MICPSDGQGSFPNFDQNSSLAYLPWIKSLNLKPIYWIWKKSEQNYGMTYLIDYNEDHAETILRDADAVCLCHSIAETHDPEKLFESCEKWLSFVRLQVILTK